MDEQYRNWYLQTTQESLTMKHYLVSWSIDVDAASPEEAAQKAQDIQKDPESIATYFDVLDVHSGETKQIDLLKP